MTATTFDSGFKSSTMALSGGSLVATSSGLGTACATRTLSGLTYWETTITTLTGTVAVGIVNRFFNTASGSILGTDNNGLSFKSSGAVVLNNVTLSTIQTYVQGNVVQVAIDIQNRLIWFNVNNGNWNNNAANNPATGVGGIDYSSMSIPQILPAVSCSATGAVFTENFSGAFTYTPPSGFITPDTNQTFARMVFGGYHDPSTLGTITAARTLGVGPGRATAPSGAAFSPAGTIKHASGIVQENGVNVSKNVWLYDSNSGEKIGQAVSDPSTGAYSIAAQGRTSVDVVAKDPTNFEAIDYDRVAPV